MRSRTLTAAVVLIGVPLLGTAAMATANAVSSSPAPAPVIQTRSEPLSDPVSSDARKKFCPQASKGAERTTQLAVTRRV